MQIFSVILISFALMASVVFDSAEAQIGPYGRLGLAALGGAVVDRTFFRPGYGGGTNYYYGYPGYYYGKKK
uniref:Uncharacterized protein n=1 Tax=Caenorhabditis japonica TaxID=281687 RepID=A0A8R1E2U1_CAEJA